MRMRGEEDAAGEGQVIGEGLEGGGQAGGEGADRAEAEAETEAEAGQAGHVQLMRYMLLDHEELSADLGKFMAHKVRQQHQDKARPDLLQQLGYSRAFVQVDYMQKWLPKSFREA